MDLGFTAARSDRKDLEFFARFRIERSYLTDEHNEKFREELARRKRDAAPASSLQPGDVAVECYGRQAERGGGWMAFHGAKGVETLELTPNSVGIWVAELAFDGSGKLFLADHARLDFYNKREKTTAAFAARVPEAGAERHSFRCWVLREGRVVAGARRGFRADDIRLKEPAYRRGEKTSSPRGRRSRP